MPEQQNITEERGFLKDHGNYIMIVRRNGLITDIWKLEEAEPKFNRTANGWIVVSKNNPTFFVSGDVEIWGINENNTELWLTIREYHEIQNEKYTQPIEIPPPPVEKPFWRWPLVFQTPVKWNW